MKLCASGFFQASKEKEKNFEKEYEDNSVSDFGLYVSSIFLIFILDCCSLLNSCLFPPVILSKKSCYQSCNLDQSVFWIVDFEGFKWRGFYISQHILCNCSNDKTMELFCWRYDLILTHFSFFLLSGSSDLSWCLDSLFHSLFPNLLLTCGTSYFENWSKYILEKNS